MKWAVVMCGALLAGAAYGGECQPASESQIEKIRASMEEPLFDAGSARFKDVCERPARRETAHKVAFCGKVNAKNRMGAYTGYREFSFISDGEPTFFTMADTSDGSNARFFYCLACLGSAQYCLKQQWIHNPKLMTSH